MDENKQYNMFSFAEDNTEKNFALNLEQLTYNNVLEGKIFSKIN